MIKHMIVLCCLAACAAAQAQTSKYLEAKTAFCYSLNSLQRYLDFAEQRDIAGLNELILLGKCAFVPDGETYRIENAHKDTLGTMPIIAFELNNTTLWTFQALVQSAESSKIATDE